MKTNSATLVFFLFSTLGPGILPSKNGMKSPGPRLFSSTPPFHFPRSQNFLSFSFVNAVFGLIIGRKKLPFCPFPINWQANFSQFVFENPAGYKLHYRRNTTGYPGSKCLSTAIKAVYSYFIKRSVFVLFSYYCQFLPYERHFSKFQGENFKNIKTC